MSWQQNLVGVQVEVNRAVFEMNQRKPDRAYILRRLQRAQSDLFKVSDHLIDFAERVSAIRGRRRRRSILRANDVK